MPTGPTVSEISLQLAQKVGIREEQSRAFLLAQAEMAYEYAREGLFIAGIGLLIQIKRPERKQTLIFGPQKGEQITVLAKNVLRFHLTEAAIGVVLGSMSMPPSVFDLKSYPNELIDEEYE